MKELEVNLGDRSYRVIIGNGIFSRLKDELARVKLSIFQPVVITNPRIFKLYAGYFKKAFPKESKLLFLKVPASERSKSWRVLSRMLESIVEYGKERSIYLVAFGGGVVGDLTGFLAAIYKRGIPYIQLPTTLLSQVDSSIGGKVAIDLKFGKNLIGAFYQPRLVLSELQFLRTLPRSQIRSGLSEIIKYGVIKNRKIFLFLEKNILRVYDWNPEDWLELIAECAKVKISVVEKDEFDKRDIRIILNFGHSIGHALESAYNYTSISHGEAVAFGMLSESLISNQIGLLDKVELERIKNLLLNSECLPDISSRAKISEILNHLPYDKKSKFGRMRFVLPREVGKVEIVEGLEPQLIRDCLKASFKICTELR